MFAISVRNFRTQNGSIEKANDFQNVCEYQNVLKNVFYAFIEKCRRKFEGVKHEKYFKIC